MWEWNCSWGQVRGWSREGGLGCYVNELRCDVNELRWGCAAVQVLVHAGLGSENHPETVRIEATLFQPVLRTGQRVPFP